MAESLTPPGTSAQIIEHPRAKSERVIQTRKRGRLPRSVGNLRNRQLSRQIAIRRAKELAEQIAKYQANIAQAEDYARECRAYLIMLQQRRAKGVL